MQSVVEGSTLAKIKYGRIFSISLVCANGQNDKEYNFSRVIRISKNWCIRREYFSVLLHGDQEVGPIWWRRLIWSLDSTLPHNILRLSQNSQNCDNQCLDKKVSNSPWIRSNWMTDKHANEYNPSYLLTILEGYHDRTFLVPTQRKLFSIIYFNNALLFKWREISQKFERWEIRAKRREQGWEEEEQAVLGRGIEYNLMRNGGVGGRKEEEKERKEEKKWGFRRLSCSSSCL